MTETLRWDNGFNVTKTKPELVWPPPVKPTMFSIAGSRRMMLTNCVSFFCIDWNEMLWSAWMPPIIRPVSCCGKKPFGMTVNK